MTNDWNGDGRKETDIYGTWSACQKDNLYSFAADKSGAFKLNCTATEPGSWEIINTKFLNYASPSPGLESERIVSMTNVEFKTTKKYTLPDGSAAIITKTWARQ